MVDPDGSAPVRSRPPDAAESGWLAPTGALTELPGIGPRTAARLHERGIANLLDLLWFFPRRYRELDELSAPAEGALGRLVRLRGTVRGARLVWLPGRRAMVTVEFAASEGTPFQTSFFNQPWQRKNFPVGRECLLEGVLAHKGKSYRLEQQRVVSAEGAFGAVQLRYPEVEGVASRRLVEWIATVLQRLDWGRLKMPPLPPGLGDFDRPPRELFESMHRPATVELHESARTHFALREAVALFEAVERARSRRLSRPAKAFPVAADLGRRIRRCLPFRLTGDQEAALSSLWQALSGASPMGVLLQGDVGTGKTAVAVAAALAVLAHGGQVAFLAPTELLAEQHYANIKGWLHDQGVAVELLTASLKAGERAALAARLAAGGPHLVFGTHALLSSSTEFARLELVIIDEQHRFGVDQRMQLVHKGRDPHVLVMTATPIPRTMALTMFGDLDALVLRQRPPGGRLAPAVFVDAQNWARVVRSIRRAVGRGGRVYVVCPAIGEDDSKTGAVRVHAALAQGLRAGLVHGRMATTERQEVLRAFREGTCDVLVGTTVLEVGLDVPEAVLMVVVAAERFGLATLHQLRGRVGRGQRRGLCILCGANNERVTALTETADGFEIAEADLRLRGSGELLGRQQSGFAELRALDLTEDQELLMRARRAVRGGPCES